MKKYLLFLVVLIFFLLIFNIVYKTIFLEKERELLINFQVAGSIYLSQLNTPPKSVPDVAKVKAIHLSYGAYNNKSFVGILKEIENSQINSIIFEIKDPFGRVAINSDYHVEVLKDLIPKLRRNGIYTIARLVMFQDPALIERNPELAILNTQTQEPWQDYKGIFWSDPTSKDVWNYNIDIANRANALGFDEINFDYVRFPTDGPIKYAKYANLEKFNDKADAIAGFLEFAKKELGPNSVLSIDVFGMSFINNQYGIGQVIEKLAPFVDVISPMPYPSHYPDNFLGFKNPAEYPYEVVSYTIERGLGLLEGHSVIVRSWIQDFNLGAVYDEFEIKEQIRAINEQGIDTWYLWNASNRYTWDAVK